MIRGNVIHIDHYGNVIFNITKDMFDACRKGRNFSIMFKRAGYALTSISHYYTDVVEGERMAMWGSNGHLIIAINRGARDKGGSAASLFGFQIKDPIRIEFYGDANSENDF
jgi:hypothetical protein